MDYKLLLFKVLKCFGDQEGVFFDDQWNYYGISDSDREQVLKEYLEYERSLD